MPSWEIISNASLFRSINELEQNLIIFTEKYNNQRLHGSLQHLTPNDFEVLWRLNLIQTMINEKRRKITFKLIIPRYQVKKHTGNSEPESSLSPRFPESSDKMMEGDLTNKRCVGPTSQTTYGIKNHHRLSLALQRYHQKVVILNLKIK